MLFPNLTRTAAKRATIEHVVETEHARQRRFARAWEAYHGQAPVPLRVETGEPDDNVRLNFARTIVDKSVAFLYGRPVALQADPEDSVAWLDAAWAANGGMVTRQKLAVNGAVTGHTFAKVMPARRAGEFPRIVVLDPSTVTPSWDSDDIDDVWRWRVQWTAVDRDGEVIARRQTVEREDAGMGWEIVDEVAEDAGSWREIGRDRHPFDWSPISHAQNLPMPNEFWGRADLEPDVLDLISAIERVASNLHRIVRLHGHPKPYVTGQEPSAVAQVDAGPDELLVLPSPAASVGQLELSSDLAAAVELYRRLREALHELTEIPEVATGKLENAGALSGVALDVLYRPLSERTQTKRGTYGPLDVELSTHMAELAGVRADELTVTWPDPLPQDPVAEAESLETDQRLGIVSRQTLAERRGYDWKAERERLDDEAREGQRRRSEGLDDGIA